MAAIYTNFVTQKIQTFTPGLDLTIDANTFYNKENPFMSNILKKELLNAPGSEKQTLHIELSLKDSGIKFVPGDSLGIYSKNNPEFVDMIIEQLGFDKYEPVWISNKSRSIRYALIEEMEITRLRTDVVSAYSSFCDSPELIEIENNQEILSQYCKDRDLLDLITEFPASITPQELCNVLRKLPPRLYSISSSQLAHPDQVHITVGVVEYIKNNRTHQGVCSTFLSNRTDDTPEIPIYIRPTNSFRLPEDGNIPVIMIGPGTGIAPFRSFLYHRQATGATGKNWLFFGDQHQDTDFLYKDELLRFKEAGLLNKLSVAFSRDQLSKIYVQHRMFDERKELFQWIQGGAVVYICGDKTRMAQDVRKMLVTIFMREGRMSVESANFYLAKMKDERRLQEDVY